MYEVQVHSAQSASVCPGLVPMLRAQEARFEVAEEFVLELRRDMRNSVQPTLERLQADMSGIKASQVHTQLLCRRALVMLYAKGSAGACLKICHSLLQASTSVSGGDHTAAIIHGR